MLRLPLGLDLFKNGFTDTAELVSQQESEFLPAFSG